MPTGVYVRTEEHLRIHREALGRPEVRKKMSESHKGYKQTEEQKMKQSLARRGENNPAYIKDRSLLKRFNDDAKDRRSSAYVTWRKEVWLRDKFTCKLANPDCSGRIEAHHILSWRDYPELRYQTNNGITLCHFHHPRKREEEKRLEPLFMELVSVSKE
jgi:hypothetical protein